MQILFAVSLFTSFYVELAFGSFLIAVNDSRHTRKLYKDLRNNDHPSEKDLQAPPEIRKRICEDVTNHGISHIITGLDPVDSMEVYEELDCENYSELFNHIFPFDGDTSGSPHTYEYVNAYVREYIFGIEDNVDDPSEYVFVCLMRHESTGNIIPFFVSKEYDVGPEGQFYKPGRFMFDSPLYHTGFFKYDTLLMLAEEPAVPYGKEDIDVELYFLRMRKYIEPAEETDMDPLCKHISDNNDDDPNNQHYRFCVAIYTSSFYSWSMLEYPIQAAAACEMREVSFRTAAAQELAAGKRYYERMTLCLSHVHVGNNMDDSDDSDGEKPEHHMYISRAYKSNHLLVYESDPLDEKFYLLNLSSNISIVDELNSFDLVED